MTATEVVAGEIRAELARQRLTTAWLAGQIGIEPSTMSRKINCKSALSIEDVVRAAEVLDVPLTRLFGDAGVRAAA